MAVLFRMPFDPVTVANIVLAGGSVTFYQTGTSILDTVFTDDALTIPATNPAPLDSSGQLQQGKIFLGLRDYRVVVKNAAGSSIPNGDIDPVHGKFNSATSTFIASGAGAVSRTVQSKLRDVVSAADFGAVGDGTTDDSAALQAWLTAIPAGGAGYLPGVATYYKVTTALTKSGFVSIFGDGTASRIHYTGSGVALTLTGPRFSRLENFYLTGTSSAAGGIWVKSAQEGYFDTGVFVDLFSGANAYARRFSSCWTGMIVGGGSRQGTNGLIFDTTLADGVNGVNNSFNVTAHDCSGNTTGIDFQRGFLANLVGNDFSSCTTGIEIGRALAGTDTIRAVSIIGNYFEVTNGVRIGRANTSSAFPSVIEITGNYISASGDLVHIYKGDSVVIGENIWGAGTITIDAGVTGTNVLTTHSITDNSTTGQTAKMRNDILQNSWLSARSILDVPVYTVSTLPPATAGRFICVSNETGGYTAAFSDGTNWRRVQDRVIVS